MTTPLAAQPMTAPAPAMRAAPRPVAMRVAPRPAAMRPVARPVAMRPAPMTRPPAASVAAMAAPTAVTPELPTRAAAPAEKVKVAPVAKKDSKASVVGGWLLQLLLGILGIAVPIIMTPFVYWLFKKMKVEDVKAKMLVDQIVDNAVGVGIHYAEEQAHKLKDNPVDGAKKLDMAGAKAQAYLKDSGIVGKGSEYLKDLIESKLGENRPAGVNGIKVVPAEEKPDPVEASAEEKKEDDKEEKPSDK